MKQAAKVATKPLAYSLQTKLDATFLSPSPVYFGQEGYSHSGRVRPRVTVFVSVTVCGPRYLAAVGPCVQHRERIPCGIEHTAPARTVPVARHGIEPRESRLCAWLLSQLIQSQCSRRHR